MRKVLLLDELFPKTGEQCQQPVLVCNLGGIDLSRITKTASEALDYVKNVKPEPGKTHLLLLALGGEETYGPNRNGDGFPERPVRSKRGVGWAVPPGEELTKHYQTFETNPAHAFKHHVNKDPKQGSGYVKKAFWNPKMHRVELLVVIDNEKDPEWVQRVNDGDFPAVSMGCRIKRDVCAICGNEAPTRADYCDHAKFQMNQVLPDGRKCYVHNPSPNFFDISRVFRPADRTGYTLKKVAYESPYELYSSAEMGDAADDVESKSATLGKLSDIHKIISGEPIASSSNLAPDEARIIQRFSDYAKERVDDAPEVPRDVLAAYAPREVFSTLAKLGMTLTAAEFLRYMTPKLAGYACCPSDAAVRNVVGRLNDIYGIYAESPALLGKVASLGIFDERSTDVRSDLAQRLAGYAVKRGSVSGMLARRLVPEGIGLRPLEAPTTDLLTSTDPATGQRWETTRGAAIDAHDAVAKTQIMKALGGAGLLYGGYRVLGAHPALRAWKAPLALGGIAAGAHYLKPSEGAQRMTDQGIPISQYTEIAPAQEQQRTAAFVVQTLLDLRGGTAAPRGERLRDKVAFVEDPVIGSVCDFDLVAEALGRMIQG